MAASVPTVDEVMLKSFGRPKIMEALELIGVRANARTGAKALKEQLLQLIQDQLRPKGVRVVGRRRRRLSPCKAEPRHTRGPRAHYL